MAMMANPDANTFVPQGPGTVTMEEEEVRDIIERLTPEKTPLYTDLSKGTTRAINTDWGTVDLGTITAAEAEKRGFKASLRAAIVPARLDNICELVAETGSVADTFDAIDLYGREDELDFQKLLKGALMKRRINKLLYANQAKSAVEPNTMACFPSWIGEDNFISIADTPGIAGTGGNGTSTYTPGVGPNAFISIDPIDDAMQAAYATNGQPTVMYMHPSVKRRWSRIPDASVAENRITMTANSPRPFMYIGTVDIYLSDFGQLEVAVDRDADPSYILMLDMDFAQIATLPGRAFKPTNLAKVGSSTDFMMEWEGTLRIWNPSAHAMVEGIDPALSS